MGCYGLGWQRRQHDWARRRRRLGLPLQRGSRPNQRVASDSRWCWRWQRCWRSPAVLWPRPQCRKRKCRKRRKSWPAERDTHCPMRHCLDPRLKERYLDHQQNPANPPSNQWKLNVLPKAHDAQKRLLTSSAKPLAHSVNQSCRSYPMMSAPKRSVRDCLSLFEPVCSAPVDEIAALTWMISRHGWRLTRRE